MSDKDALVEVYTSLSSETGVTDLVGTRIYPKGEVPDGVTLPYVTYGITSAQDANRLTAAGISDYRIETNAWATDTASKPGADLAAEVADAIWTAMTNRGHQRMSAANFYNADVDRHQHNQDFQVWVRR